MSDTAVLPVSLPAENGVHVFRAGIAVPIFTIICVSARFYSRQVLLRRRMDIGDWVVAATMVSIIAHAATMCVAAYNGMGLHVWQYTPELNTRYYLWIGISSEFYVTSLMGFKMSLLLLYLEVFGSNFKFKIACYLTMFFVFGYLISNLLTEFLDCDPPSKEYLTTEPGHCINIVAANIAYGAGSMISDLIIAILPLPMIWKLQFPSTQQKIGLSLALSSGFLAWFVGCARWGISTYDQVSNDRTWWAGISFTLSILEVNTGLICACVATLSPLMRLSVASIRSWTYGSSSKPTDSEQAYSHDLSERKPRKPSRTLYTNMSEFSEAETAQGSDISTHHQGVGLATFNSAELPHVPLPAYAGNGATHEPKDMGPLRNF